MRPRHAVVGVVPGLPYLPNLNDSQPDTRPRSMVSRTPPADRRYFAPTTTRSPSLLLDLKGIGHAGLVALLGHSCCVPPGLTRDLAHSSVAAAGLLRYQRPM